MESTSRSPEKKGGKFGKRRKRDGEGGEFAKRKFFWTSVGDLAGKRPSSKEERRGVEKKKDDCREKKTKKRVKRGRGGSRARCSKLEGLTARNSDGTTPPA